MPISSPQRRRFCVRTASLAIAASMVPFANARAESVKYSSGEEKPQIEVPPNATDCHMHFFDKRVATVPGAPVLHPDALAGDYQAFQRRIGTQRCVVVTPSAYGTNNEVTLAGMAQLGTSARGVAVVDASVTNAELERLHRLGVRGIRINLAQAGATTMDTARKLSPRIKELGWHVQFQIPSQKLVEAADILNELPSSIVFDHMARISVPLNIKSDNFRIVQRLLDRGNTWIKLSAPYLNTKIGGPMYPDASELATALVKAAPERMVWASDWPHATEQEKPDDAKLYDLLATWVPDAKARHRILVSNPTELYDFPK